MSKPEESGSRKKNSAMACTHTHTHRGEGLADSQPVTDAIAVSSLRFNKRVAYVELCEAHTRQLLHSKRDHETLSAH